MSEQRTVTATFRVVVNGYAADLEATGSLEELVGLTRKMQATEGIEPGNSPLLWKRDEPNGDSGIPTCPVHKRPMKASKHPGGGYYCTAKLQDGSYCTESVK